MAIQTQYEFNLPMGYADSDGVIHKKGTMRLATALDEIEVMNDARVKENDAYIVIALLARVITGIEGVKSINSGVIENLFAADLGYLQEFYTQINETGSTKRIYQCPHCGKPFEVDLAASSGEE